jgi:replicative DNA helicase
LYREIIKKSELIKNKSYDGNASVYPLVADTYNTLGEILDLRPSAGFDIDERMDETIEDIQKGSNNILQCGWDKIDKLSGGFTKGEVSIVGGRPGHGKTTILINMLSNFISKGLKVMLFNRELPIKEVLKKLIVLESGKLSYRQIRNSGIGANDLDEMDRVSKLLREKYSKDKFQMYDKISDFDGAAVEVRKFKPDVVIDDYVQLIKPSKRRSYEARRLEIEEIVNSYKWLAKHNNCVVILASQLNRGIEYRGAVNPEPQLSDLAESGAIEQIAENVLFTHYQWKVNQSGKNSNAHKIKLIAKKVRYGETGYVMLGYDGDKCKVYGTYIEYEKSKK